VTSGVVLGIGLRFHHHAPEQAAVLLAFHQTATNQVGGDKLRRAAEEGVREVLSDGMGSHKGGLKIGLALGNLPEKV